MKPIYPQRDSRAGDPPPGVITVHPPRESEILQEQMRRLHNARASQRAARHHRIGPISV